MQPPPRNIQGEVETTKSNVSAKIPGRVEELLAAEGQSVKKGAVLARLDTPQLAAKQRQAQAAQSAASAQRDKAEHGAREEQVRMANSQWLQAKAGSELAQSTLARVQRLFDDGVVPAQRRDEVAGQAEMARRLEAAAKAQYDMAVNGTRDEDKVAAGALVDQAAGAVTEVDSLIEEATVTAPMDGEVSEHVVNAGELVSAGMPIMTLVDLHDVWVTFNLREDDLAGLKMGDALRGTVPALNGEAIELRVTYLAPLGDFAAWRATSASGGFDLRTFEVRGKPVTPVDGLRPGMSVIVPRSPAPSRAPLEHHASLVQRVASLFR
jgi:HlyD family secretion protein